MANLICGDVMTEFEVIYNSLKNWKPIPAWQKKRSDGDFLIIMNKKLEIHYLNSTAREIVELIGNRTIQEICESMMDIDYFVEKVSRRDVINTIRDLQWKRLIRISK